MYESSRWRLPLEPSRHIMYEYVLVLLRHVSILDLDLARSLAHDRGRRTLSRIREGFGVRHQVIALRPMPRPKLATPVLTRLELR